MRPCRLLDRLARRPTLQTPTPVAFLVPLYIRLTTHFTLVEPFVHLAAASPPRNCECYCGRRRRSYCARRHYPPTLPPFRTPFARPPAPLLSPPDQVSNRFCSTFVVFLLSLFLTTTTTTTEMLPTFFAAAAVAAGVVSPVVQPSCLDACSPARPTPRSRPLALWV